MDMGKEMEIDIVEERKYRSSAMFDRTPVMLVSNYFHNG